MKKKLLDLTTREFTALLLEYSPRQEITLYSCDGKATEEDTVIGTYDQLFSTTMVHPEMHRQVVERLFDYDMVVGHLEIAQYLRYRTNEYDSDLCEALFCDIDYFGFELMTEMEENGIEVSRDKIGNLAGTFMYQVAQTTLYEHFPKEECMPEDDAPNISSPSLLSHAHAEEYLSRLTRYCDENHKWIDKTQKTLMCQCAHVIGGLLNIPDGYKWKPFESFWEVKGLAGAYYKRKGKQLDKEIRDLFPEYKGL